MKSTWFPFLGSVGLAGLGMVYANTAGEGTMLETILTGVVGGLIGFGIGFAAHKLIVGVTTPERPEPGSDAAAAPGGGWAAALIAGIAGAIKLFNIMTAS